MQICEFKVIKDLQSKKEEWLSERLGRFCGSDVGVLVKNWGNQQDLDMFGGSIEEETTFSTPLMIYLSKKYNATIPEPDKNTATAQQFGKDMEEPLVKIHNLINIDKKAKFTRDFYASTSKSQPYGCSPDGFVSLDLGSSVEAINDEEGNPITQKDGDGLLEIKTMRIDTYREKEPSWGYILQLQWNMFCTGKKWGVIFSTAPKAYNIEGDAYIKGFIAGVTNRGDMQYATSMLDFKSYYYRYDERIVTMIINAINNFINSKQIPMFSNSDTKLAIETEMLNSVFIRYMLPKDQQFEGSLAEDFDKLAGRYLKTAELRKKLEKKELIYKNKLQYQSLCQAFNHIEMQEELSKTLAEHKKIKSSLDGDGSLNDLPIFQNNFDENINEVVKEAMTKNFFKNHSVLGSKYGYVKYITGKTAKFVIDEVEKVEKKIRTEIEI